MTPGLPRLRRHLGPWNSVWLILAALYFIVPLLGTVEFSLETGPGRYGFAAYGQTLQDPTFQSTFLFSLQLAVATVVLSLVLLVPTVYWVHLRLPRLRPVMDFLGVLPFVVPPVTLAVGLLRLFQPLPWLLSGPQILVLAYVILALPFTYRSLDAGMRALDLRTLTEAAQSLGAGSFTVLLRVVLPNLRVAMLSAAFLTVTLVMGEYTVAALMLFNTFSVYMFQVGNEQAHQAAALSVISLLLTWAALLGILLAGRGVGRRDAAIGGAR